MGKSCVHALGLLWSPMRNGAGVISICYGIPVIAPRTECLSVSCSFWSRRFKSWLVPLFLSRIPEILLYVWKQSVKHRTATIKAHSCEHRQQSTLLGRAVLPSRSAHGTGSRGGVLLLVSMPSLWTCLWWIKNQLCWEGCRRHLGRRWQRPSVNSAK